MTGAKDTDKDGAGFQRRPTLPGLQVGFCFYIAGSVLNFYELMLFLSYALSKPAQACAAFSQRTPVAQHTTHTCRNAHCTRVMLTREARRLSHL